MLLTLRSPLYMAYLPRRRLVLVTACTVSSQAQWPGSQMPWDAEEQASDIVVAEPCFGSQVASSTHEPYTWSEDMQAPPDSGQQTRAATSDQQFCSQQQSKQLLCRDSLPASQPEDLLTGNLPADKLVALKSLTLSLQDYAELYTLLTKGSAYVQTASAKERTLYKLADLRQVSALKQTHAPLHSCLLTETYMQIMRLHGMCRGSRNKEVIFNCSAVKHLSPSIQQQYTSSTAVQEALHSLQGVQLLHPSLIASYKVGCSDWNAHFVNSKTPVAAEHT